MSDVPQSPDPTLEPDLRLSGSFVATLDAAYRGMWAFERALMDLDPEVDREDELEKAEHVLETVGEWWREFEAGIPLFRLHERPVLQGEASRAWRLLQVAESRARSLIGELTGSTDVGGLVADPWARTIRLAATAEVAYAQRATVAGLVRAAERSGDRSEADRWRQRLLASDEKVREAHELAERFRGEPLDEETAWDIWDATLLLPAQVAQRVIDIARVFGLYTGRFDYDDAGIPDAQVDDWAAHGFEPEVAGRWFAAGLTPARAAAWMGAGARDPMVAAGFLWRGFSPDEARLWLSRFIEGRRAAAWQAAGCNPEDAREWIALGIRDPHRISAFPATSRLM